MVFPISKSGVVNGHFFSCVSSVKDCIHGEVVLVPIHAGACRLRSKGIVLTLSWPAYAFLIAII